MSLKAKIEAVIYASEEPVTLQQLVGLLGEEAQAELNAADDLQGRLALEGSATPLMELPEASPDESGSPDAESLTPPLGPVTPSQENHEAPELPDENLPSEPQPKSATRSLDDPAVAAEDSAALEPPASTDAADPSPAAVRARERRLRDYMRSVLDRLIAEYHTEDRGLEVREIAGGYRFATKPEYHDAVRGFVRSLKPPLKLSLQALETLAVVAYKQPVTAPEVSEVRGVDSGGVLGNLLGRKLVATAGRKQVIGRPILYKTTKEFLLRFGLKDLNELPSIEEFERLASDVNGAVQEEIQMPEETVVPIGSAAENRPLSPEEVARDVDPSPEASRAAIRSTHIAQADGDPNPSIPSPDEVSSEHLTPGPDGPGEFTGNESAPPADNTALDGRISGLPPVYDAPADQIADSPAKDAAVRTAETE